MGVTISKVLDVERRESPDATPYRQRFVYRTDDEAATVATALRELNAASDLRDEGGVPADPIRWECGCLQRKCGACAMIVDGVPRLACDVRLAELPGEVVTLGPLRKFPVVADLVVSRQALFDALTAAGAWLEEAAPPADRRRAIAYEASRCLQCGCCLEACPNYRSDGPFAGMAGMAPLSRLLAVADPAERSRLARSYRQDVFAGCGGSLACRDVCPAGLDVDRLMSRSNAAALWRRF